MADDLRGRELAQFINLLTNQSLRAFIIVPGPCRVPWCLCQGHPGSDRMRQWKVHRIRERNAAYLDAIDRDEP